MANAFKQVPFQGTRHIASIAVTNGGAAYDSPVTTTISGTGYDDLVVITPATPTLVANVIQDDVGITDGSLGYTSVPTVSFAGATAGAGATGTVTLAGGLAANTNGEVYVVPASTTTVVIGCTISNNTTSAIKIDLLYYDDSISVGSDLASSMFTYCRNIVIPVESSLEIMSGNKLNLEAGDKLFIRCNTDYSFDALLSLMEIS